MKRLPLFVLAAALALPVEALAAKGQSRDAGGVVVAISASSITVRTKRGERTFDLTPATEFRQKRAAALTSALSSDITVGSTVGIVGARDKKTAERVNLVK